MNFPWIFHICLESNDVIHRFAVARTPTEAIFWRGRPAELKDTQLRQLAPMDAQQWDLSIGLIMVTMVQGVVYGNLT